MFGSGCAVQELVIADETELVVAASSIDEALLLDVGIVEFDPRIPEDNRPQKTGIYDDIRLAEAKYIPYHLKTTLQGAGHWGAVRVIPSESAFTDVIVSGAMCYRQVGWRVHRTGNYGYGCLGSALVYTIL